MHLHLAVFVYARLFQLGRTILRKETEGSAWLLSDGTKRVAKGTEEQIDNVLRTLDRLVESERSAAMEFRQESDRLLLDLHGLSRKISYAIAQQRLPHSCPLVRFF